MTLEGVDYAFQPRPGIAGLAAAGKRFACRYGGPGTVGKWLDGDEAHALAAAGMWIVANAEGSATGMLGGFAVGRAWAISADARFRACGMPTDRPIYLSADWDVQPDQWPQVREALKGAASVLGPARVGVYGGRRVIEWAVRDKAATWLWQTYAWSSGVWVPGVHIQQYRNGIVLAGGDCDLNRAMVPDYGQWQPGISGGDMSFEPDGDNWYTAIYRLEAIVRGLDKVAGGPSAGEAVVLVQQIHQLAADVAALKAGGIDLDALAVKVAALMPMPYTLAEIAAAVLDEDHRRSAA